MKTIGERFDEMAEAAGVSKIDKSYYFGRSCCFQIATEQRKIDIEKAKRSFCKAKECVPYEECQRANGGCFAMQRFIKSMEE